MTCPICNSDNCTTYMDRVTDFMVTQENFNLYKCADCECLITQPVPDNIGQYYNSDRYLSHHSEGSSIISSIYRSVRRININNKINILNSYVNGNTLLDIGCGTGDFILKAKQKGFDVRAVEPDNDARLISEQKTGIQILEDITQLSGSYNAITLWHVLEHMSDPLKTIYTLTNHLEENGIIILALPNYKSFDASHYKNYWAGYDVPRHLFHFSKNTINFIAQQTGLTVQKIHPMSFDAYYVSLLSEQYNRSSWENYPDALQLGFRSNRKASHTGEYSSLIYILKAQ